MNYLINKGFKCTSNFVRRQGFLRHAGLWYYRFSQIEESKPIFYKDMDINKLKSIEFKRSYAKFNTGTPNNKRMKLNKPVGSIDLGGHQRNK